MNDSVAYLTFANLSSKYIHVTRSLWSAISSTHTVSCDTCLVCEALLNMRTSGFEVVFGENMTLLQSDEHNLWNWNFAV